MNREVMQEQVRIASQRGELAGELAYPLRSEPVGATLIINPHPYMGGHMGNNVVTALAGGLSAAGLVTLRFDYAGVGESNGVKVDLTSGMDEFWRTGRSVMDSAIHGDVADAARWLRENVPLPIVLIGYSFGAQATQVALSREVAAVVLISPTVVHHDLSIVAGLNLPKLVIYSDDDFSTPLSSTQAWLSTVRQPMTAHCIGSSNHFFKGREEQLTAICRSFLSKHLLKKEASCRP